MGRFEQVLCYICLVGMCCQEITANPFLYNSGQSIISSIFSSSGPADTKPNIEDLREEKVEKHESQRLDSEEREFYARTEAEEEMKNEASPGLLQKKIGKILAKLQLFSTIRSSLNPPTKQEEENGSEGSFESHEGSTPIIEIIVKNNSSNILKINGDESMYLPPVSTKIENRLDDGNRFRLLSSVEDEAPLLAESVDHTKLELTPGFGVYVMELLGGFAALIYGAAIQVANMGNTTPNPNL